MLVVESEAKFDSETYLYDDSFRAGNTANFRSVHTVPEMMEHLANSKTEASGVMLECNSRGEYRYRKFSNKEQLIEAYSKGARSRKIREANSFAYDGWGANAGTNAGLVGDDFVPLLGGPFFKQQYLNDYLRSQAYCFHEFNHHPLAKAAVNITRDFVLGRGYRIDSEDKQALAYWQAFEEVNDMQHFMNQLVVEGCVDGETMIWWLPEGEAYIQYNLSPAQQASTVVIPRIRLIDPSTCWEIVTFPEDVTRVISYRLIFPTQYQIFTGQYGGQAVPTSKFIMQELPAGDVMHFKYNCFSNEKRGRSDLFPVLGYLKWIRDCVNYKLVSLKKQAAWTEDISVEGSQTDVDNLASSLQALGEFEPAGSRFIHTSKVKREYMANQGGSNGSDSTLDWGLNMFAAGVQIPVTYFGLTHSAGQTKASAIVGTEPVAKKMERRQLECKRILQFIWRKFQDKYGVKGSQCDITFPEIITQDRSLKLKDIKFTEDSGYISRARAANMASKELDIDKYDYDSELEDIEQESPQPLLPTIVTPLTAPSAVQKPTPTGANNSAQPTSSLSAVTSQDRAQINKLGSS